MKPQEEDMYPELSSWILNQEQWTLSELVHSVNSSDLITLSSVKLEQEITGLKVTIQKELNLLTQSSMLQEKKLKDVIVFKDSKSPTHWEVEQGLEWVPSLSRRSEKNIPIELCKPSLLYPLLKCQTQSLNPTTPPSQSINWLKMLMNA